MNVCAQKYLQDRGGHESESECESESMCKSVHKNTFNTEVIMSKQYSAGALSALAGSL